MKLTLPFPPSVNSYWRAPSKGPLKGRHMVSETGRKFQKAARAAIIEQLRAVPRPSSDLAEVHIVLFPPDQRRRDIDNYKQSAVRCADTNRRLGGRQPGKTHVG